MKFLSEEEALKARSELEKSLKEDPINPKEVEYSGPEIKDTLLYAYDAIISTLRCYMDLPPENQNIIALWIIGTYFHDKFNTYPYLFINAMRGSGKTRLLKIIDAFSKDSLLTMAVTESTLFRTKGTLLIDEFEGVNKKGNEPLRELLNCAYKKGIKIIRMKKKKTIEGENQVAEEFLPYRPICLANIYGMEEVLNDRCITTQLEKSDIISKIKLVEAYKDLFYVKSAKNALLEISESVVSVDVVSPGNINLEWNIYVQRKYNNYTNYTNYTTTLNNTNDTDNNNNNINKELWPLNYLSQDNEFIDIHEKELNALLVEHALQGRDVISYRNTGLFEKIDATGIDGRNLELFFPLFLIANCLNEDILNLTLDYACKITKQKKEEEQVESNDVTVYRLVSLSERSKWINVKDLTQNFKLMLGDGENEWVNSKWLGRALKRLNLIIDKRRVSDGRMVILDIDKAKKKMEMFR